MLLCCCSYTCLFKSIIPNGNIHWEFIGIHGLFNGLVWKLIVTLPCRKSWDIFTHPSLVSALSCQWILGIYTLDWLPVHSFTPWGKLHSTIHLPPFFFLRCWRRPRGNPWAQHRSNQGPWSYETGYPLHCLPSWVSIEIMKNSWSYHSLVYLLNSYEWCMATHQIPINSTGCHGASVLIK